jgi:hypothetical protein
MTLIEASSPSHLPNPSAWDGSAQRVIERFGADAALPDVLMDLAACERRKDFSAPCGARFTDLAS